MAYVNVHGQPVDLRALAAKAPEHRAIMGADGPTPKRKPTVLRGYAAQPGTGPEGKACRDCEHKQTMGNYGGKQFIKCLLMKTAWTHGEGTDIRASSPACSRFAQKAPA